MFCYQDAVFTKFCQVFWLWGERAMVSPLSKYYWQCLTCDSFISGVIFFRNNVSTMFNTCTQPYNISQHIGNIDQAPYTQILSLSALLYMHNLSSGWPTTVTDELVHGKYIGNGGLKQAWDAGARGVRYHTFGKLGWQNENAGVGGGEEGKANCVYYTCTYNKLCILNSYEPIKSQHSYLR